MQGKPEILKLRLVFLIINYHRLAAIITEKTLLEAAETLSGLGETEMGDSLGVKADLELMTCVKRRVKQVARELGILMEPESEEMSEEESQPSQKSQESQDLLKSSQRGFVYSSELLKTNFHPLSIV